MATHTVVLAIKNVKDAELVINEMIEAGKNGTDVPYTATGGLLRILGALNYQPIEREG